MNNNSRTIIELIVNMYWYRQLGYKQFEDGRGLNTLFRRTLNTRLTTSRSLKKIDALFWSLKPFDPSLLPDFESWVTLSAVTLVSTDDFMYER